jgi:hypothetical protein
MADQPNETAEESVTPPKTETEASTSLEETPVETPNTEVSADNPLPGSAKRDVKVTEEPSGESVTPPETETETPVTSLKETPVEEVPNTGVSADDPPPGSVEKDVKVTEEPSGEPVTPPKTETPVTSKDQEPQSEKDERDRKIELLSGVIGAFVRAEIKRRYLHIFYTLVGDVNADSEEELAVVLAPIVHSAIDDVLFISPGCDDEDDECPFLNLDDID